MLDNLNAYLLEEGTIRISEKYVRLAFESNGHLDVYFAPFLLNKFSFEGNLWFTNFKDSERALHNYARIFQLIANESAEYSDFDFEGWYYEQVDKIIGGQFQIEDLVPLLNHTRYNPWV